jgi:hypothetical protein
MLVSRRGFLMTPDLARTFSRFVAFLQAREVQTAADSTDQALAGSSTSAME